MVVIVVIAVIVCCYCCYCRYCCYRRLLLLLFFVVNVIIYVDRDVGLASGAGCELGRCCSYRFGSVFGLLSSLLFLLL